MPNIVTFTNLRYSNHINTNAFATVHSQSIGEINVDFKRKNALHDKNTFSFCSPHRYCLICAQKHTFKQECTYTY